MNKFNRNPTNTLILLMRWLLVHQKQNSDGYAMIVASIITILIFSLLSVYLFSTNLYKSSANALLDGNSTFFAAETGMNQRANLVRKKFEEYSQPVGSSPNGVDVAEQMQRCMTNRGATDNAATVGTGDFRCLDTTFDYKESAWKASGNSGLTEKNENNPDVKYRAYSFIRQITGTTAPAITKVPAGEAYAGLNMQEYKYRVYATARKESEGYMPVSAQTLLQMDFNSRVIPLFQFAAFYEGELEITSSSDMSLNGRIHSNSNVWFAPGGTLRASQTTAATKQDTLGNWVGGKIYKSLNRLATHGGLNPGKRVILGSNAPIDVSGAWSNANTQVTAAEISSSTGLLQPGATRLEIPPIGFLNRTGNYYNQADFRVTFDPNNAAQPFGVQSQQGGVTTTFSAQMVRSLRQPVMLVTQSHRGENKNSNLNTTEWNNLCVGTGANFTSSPINNSLNPSSLSSFTWTVAQANAVSDALRRALAKTTTIYTFSQLNDTAISSNMSGLGDLRIKFQTELNDPSVSFLTVAQKTTLSGTSSTIKPREIANKAGNCFLPPPMRVQTGQQDRQEARSMTILQSNIHSLTIWNRDGQYSNDGINVLNANSQIFALKPDIDTAISNGVPEASIPVGSYEWMGLAASDTTQGGLVWHFSVDPSYTITAGQSPYGFGFSGGRWLPGPLTLATDQIAYIQGDFNNPGGVQPTFIGEDVFSGTGNAGAGISRAENLRQKKPAAVMADAIATLSNNCDGPNGELNCFNVANNTPLPLANTTSVNAAFLAGTMDNSGLNNYMRMMENWGGSSGTSLFRYRGSFVSLGAPQKVSGIYRSSSSTNATATNYYVIPGRDFGYDTSFDSVSGLPPLSPQVAYLKQKVFKRDYDNSRN